MHLIRELSLYRLCYLFTYSLQHGMWTPGLGEDQPVDKVSIDFTPANASVGTFHPMGARLHKIAFSPVIKSSQYEDRSGHSVTTYWFTKKREVILETKPVRSD